VRDIDTLYVNTNWRLFNEMRIVRYKSMESTGASSSSSCFSEVPYVIPLYYNSVTATEWM
jgi:hypothetical protein